MNRRNFFTSAIGAAVAANIKAEPQKPLGSPGAMRIAEEMRRERESAMDITISRIRCEDSFHEFVRQAWPVVYPDTPFMDHWTVGQFCSALQCDGRRVAIHAWPGFGTSTLCAIMYTAWEWTRNPKRRILTRNHCEAFAVRDAIHTKRLIESDWYRARWGERVSLIFSPDKRGYENRAGGYRIAAAIGGFWSHRGDCLIVDSPNRPSETEAQRDGVRQKYELDWLRLQDNPKTNRIILASPRYHDNDLHAHVLSTRWGGPQWAVRDIYIRKMFCCGEECAIGDPTWPERFPEETIQQWERCLGPERAAAQLMQNPGGMYS